METKPGIHTNYIIRCVHRITQNRVADMSHMNAELVTPDIVWKLRMNWLRWDSESLECRLEFNLRRSEWRHIVPSSEGHQSHIRRLNSANGRRRSHVIMIIKNINSCYGIFAIFVTDDLENQQQNSNSSSVKTRHSLKSKTAWEACFVTWYIGRVGSGPIGAVIVWDCTTTRWATFAW